MQRRRPPNRSAQAVAIARKQQQPQRQPSAQASTARAPSAPSRPAEAQRSLLTKCPVCGAGVFEFAGLGCCGAESATCEGSIDGVPVDWDAIETDEESDRLDDLAERHDWYVDTGEQAPAEYPRPGQAAIACRCERPAAPSTS